MSLRGLSRPLSRSLSAKPPVIPRLSKREQLRRFPKKEEDETHQIEYHVGFVCVCKSTHARVCVCVHMYTHMHVKVNVHICTHQSVCLCACMRVYIYIYICIYIYIHTYIYIYMCIQYGMMCIYIYIIYIYTPAVPPPRRNLSFERNHLYLQWVLPFWGLWGLKPKKKAQFQSSGIWGIKIDNRWSIPLPPHTKHVIRVPE